MDPARFVFLDETGVTTKMTRLYGRAQRGERLVDAVPHGHWRTTTLIAGLRQSGVIAPVVLDGPMRPARYKRAFKTCPHVPTAGSHRSTLTLRTLEGE
jgi:hypothetical protein